MSRARTTIARLYEALPPVVDAYKAGYPDYLGTGHHGEKVYLWVWHNDGRFEHKEADNIGRVNHNTEWGGEHIMDDVRWFGRYDPEDRVVTAIPVVMKYGETEPPAYLVRKLSNTYKHVDKIVYYPQF